MCMYQFCPLKHLQRLSHQLIFVLCSRFIFNVYFSSSGDSSALHRNCSGNYTSGVIEEAQFEVVKSIQK